VQCVIIVSCVQLSAEIVEKNQDWLLIHVPGFAHFEIQDSGKYLGWILGMRSVELSYSEPIVKFVDRIGKICNGKAPAATSIFRYNQRAASVLSYVAQFAPPHLIALTSPTSPTGPFIRFYVCLRSRCLENCVIALGSSLLWSPSHCVLIVKLFNSDLLTQRKIVLKLCVLKCRRELGMTLLALRACELTLMEFLVEGWPPPLFWNSFLMRSIWTGCTLEPKPLALHILSMLGYVTIRTRRPLPVIRGYSLQRFVHSLREREPVISLRSLRVSSVSLWVRSLPTGFLLPLSGSLLQNVN
jgi:hypothetical protein